MITVFYRGCGNTHNEQHTAAYELLYAAASFLGFKTGEIKKTPEGKPYFDGIDSVFFSISHTKGMAVVAIGDRSCGVDTEADRKISERVRNKFLDGASEDQAVKLWTQRESYGKYEGSGFFAKDQNKKVKYAFFNTDGYFITLCTDVDAEISENLIAL